MQNILRTVWQQNAENLRRSDVSVHVITASGGGGGEADFYLHPSLSLVTRWGSVFSFTRCIFTHRTPWRLGSVNCTVDLCFIEQKRNLLSMPETWSWIPCVQTAATLFTDWVKTNPFAVHFFVSVTVLEVNQGRERKLQNFYIIQIFPYSPIDNNK